MNAKNAQVTISNRIEKDQKLLIEQLKKTPIIQIACEKTGIGRATYYRWRKDNKEFAQLADEALKEGTLLVNDMAESQLLSAVRDQNMTGIIFWLKHHHPTYATKVEITANLKQPEEELTAEQQEAVKKALALTGFTENSAKDEK